MSGGFRHALVMDISSQYIALTSPLLPLTQVIRISFLKLQPRICIETHRLHSFLRPVQIPPAPKPITTEAQLQYIEGWSLFTSAHFKDAAACLRKSAELKHPLAAALLSDLLFWGTTGLAIDKEASLKLAQDGAETGCAHCKGMLAMN
jgi:hypothetical protein